MLFGLVFAVPPGLVCIADAVGGYFGPRETTFFVIVGLAPCVLLNLHSLSHPRRPTRLRLFPVFVAALLGLGLSYCADAGLVWPARYINLAPAAVAAGIVIGIQIVSPKHHSEPKALK